MEIQERKQRRELRKTGEAEKRQRRKHRENCLLQQKPGIAASNSDWVQCSDTDGNSYFYNSETGETTWEMPNEFHSLLRDRYRNQTMSAEEQLRAAFDEFDTDYSGCIDKHELGNLSEALGYPLDNRTLQVAMSTLDRSGDGSVSFEEFSWWWNQNS